MLRRSRRTDAEVEAFKRTLRSPICEVPGCLGLNDDDPGGVEGINCITYQTETGTRVVCPRAPDVAPVVTARLGFSVSFVGLRPFNCVCGCGACT
jgi:hypothetical protein